MIGANSQYSPELVAHPVIPGHRLVIIYEALPLSENQHVLSEFMMPTIKMALEIRKAGATRCLNSFLIFRTFFSRSISQINPSEVGKISKIAQSVWKVASAKFKKAFVALERGCSHELCKNFVFLNSKTPRKKNPFNATSTHVNESVNTQNYPPLDIRVTTSDNFRTREPSSTVEEQTENCERLYPVPHQDYGIPDSNNTWYPNISYESPPTMNINSDFQVNSTVAVPTMSTDFANYINYESAMVADADLIYPVDNIIDYINFINYGSVNPTAATPVLFNVWDFQFEQSFYPN